MNYLQLINNVLTRLREDTITTAQIDTDPYWRSIGAHVNDAKDRVEDAWEWGALRGTDVVGVPVGQFVDLPNSADNHYIINRVYSSEFYDPLLTLPPLTILRQVSVGEIRQLYQGGIATVPVGQPNRFAVTGTDPTTGNIRVTVFPRADTADEYALTLDRVSHQDSYAHTYDAQGNITGNNFSDTLLVPSLPVYTLATALASRERGEVGGTPTSELFSIADRHLSDAIAQDSALYPNEMIWYSSGEGWANTNVKTA